MSQATPDQAEAAAHQAIRQYLNDCKTPDMVHASNCLMKLVSVASVYMAQSCGCHEAATRLEGTAAFIRQIQAEPINPSAH